MTYVSILGAILFISMCFWFVVSLRTRRNDVADEAWGLGFVVLAWASFVLGEGAGIRGLIVTLLVTVWGLRLFLHIRARHVGKPEDPRYRVWRETWGRWFVVRSFFQVFMLQGVLLFLVVLPVLIINRGAGEALGWLDVVGLAIWALGFYFETRADRELARFLADPANRGTILQTGLWRYSRHPNYFGEVTQWWGIGLIALSVTGGVIGLVGPITITILILFVSGIPMLEKRMMEREDFRAYARRTSVFIPLPPKRLSDVDSPAV